MKIYVVMGSSGEYSDRKEWIVGAWLDESTARDRVMELSLGFNEIWSRRPEDWWDTNGEPDCVGSEMAARFGASSVPASWSEEWGPTSQECRYWLAETELT